MLLRTIGVDGDIAERVEAEFDYIGHLVSPA
jgi:hypothetical protein